MAMPSRQRLTPHLLPKAILKPCSDRMPRHQTLLRPQPVDATYTYRPPDLIPLVYLCVQNVLQNQRPNLEELKAPFLPNSSVTSPRDNVCTRRRVRRLRLLRGIQ